MMTRRTFAAGILCGMAARGDVASRQQQGRQIVDQCVRALGGPSFLNMQDRMEFGRAYSFYRERLSGLSLAHLYTRYPEPPKPMPSNFYGIWERQAFGKKEDDSVLFTSDGGYELTFRGVRPLPDESVSKHKESTITNILYILRQRLHEPGLTFEYNGIEVVENQRVESLDVFDSANRKITVYLGVDNKLPVLQRYLRLDAVYKERIEELARFSKYRDIGGGVMWPFAVGRERDGELIYQMFCEKVTVGNNFDEKMFSLPRGMQMLKKETF